MSNLLCVWKIDLNTENDIPLAFMLTNAINNNGMDKMLFVFARHKQQTGIKYYLRIFNSSFVNELRIIMNF